MKTPLKNVESRQFLMLVCFVRFLQRYAYGAYIALAWLTWKDSVSDSGMDSHFLFDASSLVMLTFGFQAFLEVPAGILADHVGRARAVMVGLFLTTICYTLYWCGPQLDHTPTVFYLLSIGELCMAGGMAMASGAFEAWAIDGVNAISQEKQSRVEDYIVARMGWVSQLASLIGGITALTSQSSAFALAALSCIWAFSLVAVLSWRESQHFSLEGDSTQPQLLNSQLKYVSPVTSFFQMVFLTLQPRKIFNNFHCAFKILLGTAGILVLWVILIPSELVGQTAEYLWSALAIEPHESAPFEPTKETYFAFALVNIGGLLGSVLAEIAVRNNAKRTTIVLSALSIWLVFGALVSIEKYNAILVVLVPIILKCPAQVIFVTGIGRLNTEITIRKLSHMRATLLSSLIVIGTSAISVFSLVQKFYGNYLSQARDAAVIGISCSLLIFIFLILPNRHHFNSTR